MTETGKTGKEVKGNGGRIREGKVRDRKGRIGGGEEVGRS